MNAFVRVTILALAAVALSAIAPAQQTSSGFPYNPGTPSGFCGTDIVGTVFCFEDQSCAVSTDCNANNCPAGFRCLVNECCHNSPTMGKCLLNLRPCSNPGVCGTFEQCEFNAAVPAVSTVGLVVLTGVLLAAGAFLVNRRGQGMTPA